MAEKTVHFHVGSGRCGSTLLQVILNLPAVHEMLKTFGYKSDLSIYAESGQLTLGGVVKFNQSEWRDFRDHHFRAFRIEPFTHLVATQENMFGIHHEPGSRNACDESCRLVRYLTEDYNARIVILLRRQDTFIESLYNQSLKGGEQRPFEQYLDEFPLDNLKWDTVLDTYVEHFGNENVTVIPFEKWVVTTGPHAGFVAAFFAAIGIPVPIFFGEQMQIINASLAPRAMEVQRAANIHLPPQVAGEVANWFIENVKKRPDEKYTLIDDGRRRALIDYYQSSNQRLTESYFKNYDASYYLGRERGT